MVLFSSMVCVNSRCGIVFFRWLLIMSMLILPWSKIIPHLEFTHTIEENNTITYLDLNIQRDMQNLLLSIHRKPKQTDITIHYTSNHPIQHKMAAYNTYIHRMLTLPITKQVQQKEWDIICSTASNNGYPLSLIHHTRNKIIQKITMQQHKTQT